MAESRFRFVLSNEGVGTHEIAAPASWDDMQHTLKRDSLYHGISVAYTLDFDFIRSGYGFLQAVYNTYGVEGVALLTVYELLPNEHRWEPVYSGRINLAKYVAGEISCTTNADETGFKRTLKNLEDVEIDLRALESLDGRSLVPMPAHTIEMHSKAIVKSFEGKVSQTQPEYSYRPVTTAADRGGTIYVGFDDIAKDDLGLYNYATGLSLSDEELELKEFDFNGPIKVRYNIRFKLKCLLESGDFDEAAITWYIGIDNQLQEVYRWVSREAYGGNDINGPLDKDVIFSGEKTYNVRAGQKLFFFGRTFVQDTTNNYEFEWVMQAHESSTLEITATTTTAPTYATGMLLHESFSRTVESITGQPNSFYSELLGRTDSAPRTYAADGAFGLVWLTNGSQLRGFPISQRSIFANLKDQYNSLNALNPVGLCTEYVDGKERVRLEDISFFYRSEVVLELGQVNDLKLSVAQEYFYNQVDVGYEKWGSNQDNSLDEFNTKQTRVTPITQLKGVYGALSKYPASGYLIEDVRRDRYETSSNKEGSNDKTNFLVCVSRSGSVFRPERNENFVELNNVFSPDTIYNARISPARNMRRHWRMISSCFRFLTDRPLKFQQGEANYLLESRMVGETQRVAENATVNGSDLTRPLWINEYYDFSVRLPAFQRKLIEQNPYGLITFKDSGGRTKKGYLKELKVNIATGDADIKLLRFNE